MVYVLKLVVAMAAAFIVTFILSVICDDIRCCGVWDTLVKPFVNIFKWVIKHYWFSITFVFITICIYSKLIEKL